MLEYAIIRLTFDCTAATRLPSVIVRAAIIATIMSNELKLTWNNPPYIKTRINAANPAAFEPTEKKAVAGAGEPS